MYVQEIPNYSVLYIGDSEYDFGQIRHKFNAVESFSCDLEWVSSVEDGLELLAKNKFDVYFVDYKLSLINGVELFKRSRSLGGKNPVILLMDNYDENSVIKPLKLGFDDYIIKSEINPNFLRRSVRYAVDRNKNLEKIRSAEKETLTAKRVAEEASKIKSEFIINLSNELKIPLNTMKETSAFFKEIVAGEDQKNYFHTLENVQDDLCEIIDNISVFSDIEAKIFKINFEEFSLHQVINEVNMYYFPKLSQKGIKIDFEISDQINEKIYGDYEKLIQVLHYLIDNAIDLTLKGEIHLGIEIFSKDKDTILFTVSDTGIGIPKDRISNIFNSFEQRQEETGSKKFGSGLGLTLSKRIIELLGGKIWVQSIEGQGSCFYFTLPIKFEMLNNKSISSDHSIENNDSNNCKRILLADDTEDMRNLVEIYLSLMSYKVIPVTDGQEALELFKKEKFDVVLMDMRMPVMDGLEATEEIRKYEQENDLTAVPIIALTAYSEESEIEQTYKAGCDYHMVKPVNREALVEALEKALGSDESKEIVNNSIRVDVDEDLKELIPGYLKKRFEDVAQFREWVLDENYMQIQELSHKIKGSGGGYGFQELSEYAAVMEQEAKNKTMPLIVENLDKIENYIKNVEVNYVLCD